jgi:group I intron endonuclease
MTAGIYRIQNINNGKCYIGQSKNLELRWQYHLIRLRMREHKSPSLQHDFNTWLTENYTTMTPFPFVFEILLECDITNLTKYEETFIAALQPLYNTQRFKSVRNKMSKEFIREMKEKYK